MHILELKNMKIICSKFTVSVDGFRISIFLKIVQKEHFKVE